MKDSHPPVIVLKVLFSPKTWYFIMEFKTCFNPWEQFASTKDSIKSLNTQQFLLVVTCLLITVTRFPKKLIAFVKRYKVILIITSDQRF